MYVPTLYTHHCSHCTVLYSVCPLQPSGDDKKKKNKDPNAPKKGLSPYFIWLKETRDSIKRKYPGISFGELGKKAGEMWKTVSKSVSYGIPLICCT